MASPLVQGVSDQCINVLEKIADVRGRGARLDSLRSAPERLDVNFKRFLKTEDDAVATIKSRIRGAGVKARQLANVVGYCVKESDKPSSKCLENLTGEKLKKVIGEQPRETTSVTESLRAKTEQVKYFVNKNVLRQPSASLQGTRPTVERVNWRAQRNAVVDKNNRARREETAQALKQHVQSVGLLGALANIKSLVHSNDFQERVRAFPERVTLATPDDAGDPVNSVSEVSPESSENNSVLAVKRRGVEAFDCIGSSAQQLKETPYLPTIVEERADAEDDNCSVGSDESVDSVRFLAASAVLNNDMPKSDITKNAVPSSNGAEQEVSNSVVGSKTTKLGESSAPVPALSPSAPLAPNDNYRDWITIVGRVASLATLAALAYSYFASGSVESTALVPIS